MNVRHTFPPIVPRQAKFDAESYFKLAPVLKATFDKTELRDGIIIEMPSDGVLTTLWNSAISTWLYQTIGSEFLVVTDKSLRLGDHWVPSPDHYVLSSEAALAAPGPDTILLVIEVSDTTLESDLGDKADAYARHGVREYWVVDPSERCIYVHRLANGEDYGAPVRVDDNERVSAQNIPNLTLCLADLPRIS